MTVSDHKQFLNCFTITNSKFSHLAYVLSYVLTSELFNDIMLLHNKVFTRSVIFNQSYLYYYFLFCFLHISYWQFFYSNLLSCFILIFHFYHLKYDIISEIQIIIMIFVLISTPSHQVTVSFSPITMVLYHRRRSLLLFYVSFHHFHLLDECDHLFWLPIPLVLLCANILQHIFLSTMDLYHCCRC